MTNTSLTVLPCFVRYAHVCYTLCAFVVNGRLPFPLSAFRPSDYHLPHGKRRNDTHLFDEKNRQTRTIGLDRGRCYRIVAPGVWAHPNPHPTDCHCYRNRRCHRNPRCFYRTADRHRHCDGRSHRQLTHCGGQSIRPHRNDDTHHDHNAQPHRNSDTEQHPTAHCDPRPAGYAIPTGESYQTGSICGVPA